ncbi:hypothetical protein CYLTODRAFT_424686 [Cylindrobasidium torrendii FP15055 ss-10]|uniref:Mediator complex subunit 1 n=1 Tax=Cylindrobasidium torrendii FP15055 ss-10 TaxID=1314674 RepID=A0A0D7B3G3_9AGAR|nr:hypothetical protein CYLTODRAFT_424686 [Cylindrobasidium torrendii FP15055 ss-10]
MSTPRPIPNLPPSLLSLIQAIQTRDAISHATHPFASSSGPSRHALQEIDDACNALLGALNLYRDPTISNPALLTRLKEQAAISHALHQAEMNTKQTVEALKRPTAIKYGEDIPLDRRVLVEWSMNRFQIWGRASGMETYVDGDAPDQLMLAGKVLVIDIDFTADRSIPERPRLEIKSVRTSYAIPGAESNKDGSLSLDAFLLKSMRAFCEEVQRPEDQVDPLEAARLAVIINDHLSYLLVLDRFAARPDDGGLRWFVDVDQMCTVVEDFSRSEAQAIASSLGLQHAPLDIFLLRAHTLPLPYLKFPSISFLVYLSPAAYLLLRRLSSASTNTDDPSRLPQLDIPMTDVRKHLSRTVRPKGATIANLALSIHSEVQPGLYNEAPSLRPAFPLVPSGAQLEHKFPHTTSKPPNTEVTWSTIDVPQESPPFWLLDFTEGGRLPGVTVSQSRMRGIQAVVDSPTRLAPFPGTGIMSDGSGSWVDLLLNPSPNAVSERYTAIYRSPSSAHPPLHLHLTAPEEPGFVLEKVPVCSMKEVWGVLEIVREQCWLNEILLGYDWTPEGPPSADADDTTEATEAEVQAILTGTFQPRKIPVSIKLPMDYGAVPPSPEGSIDQVQTYRPAILMSAPERTPLPGLVKISVVYDETRPRGVEVKVQALNANFEVEKLEEACRRGAALGLAGRIWAGTPGPS